MERKKICFVVASPSTARIFLANHIKTLDSVYDVYLVANLNGFKEGYYSDLPIKLVKHIEIHRKINLIKDIKAFVSMIIFFRKQKFDAVHSVSPKAGLISSIAASISQIRVRIHIFTGQVWYTRKGLFKKFLMLLDKLIVRSSTHVLVDGKSQMQFLINKEILKPGASFVLGEGSISGVDTKKFIPNREIKSRVRKDLKINDTDIVFMFLGRMNVDKGIPELADAYNTLRNKYKNVRLLLVGEDEENMKEVINQKVVDSDSIIFYGVTKNPEYILQACDVFCLPSHREGFGTSIIEASLLEKPVICSDTYGVMETIIENKTGLRHQVGDIDSLYLQMEKLVSEKRLREELGLAGRKYVLKNFSAELISEKWLDFYKNNI